MERHMPFLRNNDVFPALEIPAIGGGTISIPAFSKGEFGVVIAYRGAWCPFCVAQLAGFATEKAALNDLGVQVVAFSVDDEKTTQELAQSIHFPYLLGHSASADRIAEQLGTFINNEPKYLQPTAFILTPKSEVLASVYASHAVGRLLATDAVKLIGYMKSKMAA
jgi:peroxiredoxin